MNTSEKGINLIKQSEGLYLKTYICPAGVLTIGYGHTGVDVHKNDEITEAEADQLLIMDLQKFEKDINKLNLPINQNQFDALISFSFNLGFGNLLISTLLKKIKINPNDESITKEFMKWNKAKVNGVLTELPGLTKRRKAEAELYFEKI